MILKNKSQPKNKRSKNYCKFEEKQLIEIIKNN